MVTNSRSKTSKNSAGVASYTQLRNQTFNFPSVVSSKIQEPVFRILESRGGTKSIAMEKNQKIEIPKGHSHNESINTLLAH